ncbi:MAG TPA: ABC transporter substrate-binding protein [Terrimesophilobacter sp.]|nr:ABC transporter substrate-binding protein [Terrimesophilobacter sp.]
MPRIRTAAAALALTALVLAGCSGDPMPTPSPSASPTPTPEGSFGDGELLIGSLVPMTGSDAGIALAQVAGVELAVREINEAGGVGGVPIVTVHRDSGDASTETLAESFAELVDRGVDVVIGPSSVDLARRLAPLAVEAGVMVISPAISDPSAGSIDASGLFARTLPSAAYDGAGIAAQLPPRARVGVVYFSDATGKGIRDSLADALPAAQSQLVTTLALTPSMRNPDTIIDKLNAARVNVVVYAGSAGRTEQNTIMLTALAEADIAPALWLTSPVIARHNVAPGTLEGALAIRAGGAADDEFTTRLRSADPRATDQRTGAEAYDAVILAALAATVAGDDGGVAISRTIAGVSADGISCHSWAHCLHVLDTSDAWGNNINYEGQSGSIDFGSDLSAVPSHYGVFILDAKNSPKPAP